MAEKFELVLKHWMANRLVFSALSEGAKPEGSGYVALTARGQRRLWEITEDPSHPVSRREPYDEDSVPKLVDQAAKTCEVAALAGFTFFDRLISGNKALINQLLNPGVKLIAAKIETHGFPADDAGITLVLKSHAGPRIFKSALLVDGVPNGEVVFYGE